MDTHQKPASFFQFSLQDNQPVLSIARTEGALRDFNHALLAACSLDKKIFLEKAQLKDHNEDLKQKLGLSLVLKAQKASSLHR